MLKAVNAKEFDLVATWSVDRLGRSLTDLLSILQCLRDKGVDLFLHQQGLDTSTAAGKAMFQMLGVFAEFERGIIRERVNAGLARARANGTKLGRRPVKPAVEARIRRLRAKACSRSAGPWALAPASCSGSLATTRGRCGLYGLRRGDRATAGAISVTANSAPTKRFEFYVRK
jgi:DNA invertase Pin-like site-specific DNA recombinase